MAEPLLSIEDGWLMQAQQCLSPNFNPRPAGISVNMVVIHNISLPPAEFGTECIKQFFCNQLDCDAHPYFDQIRGLQVSSHLLIDRSGVMTQFVNFNDRAWHAGQSHFQGCDNCNDFSIGIELEGTDDIPYTQAQYDQLAVVIRALQVAYPNIQMERLVGHSDIAPGRKTDPGSAFSWIKLKQGLI